MHNQKSYIKNIDIILTLFILLLLFLLPLIFTRENGMIAWPSVLKIWQDRVLVLPLFVINHWLLVPKLVLNKKYSSYGLIIFLLIAISIIGYYFYDKPAETEIANRPPERERPLSLRNDIPQDGIIKEHPQSVPPYADLLLFSLLIVAMDTGLSFTRQWQTGEEQKVRLEKENIEAQLGMLRNQISPHFFMNTLNNIYALIDADKHRSKQSVMKLSKLMRYLLYENMDGKVLISREFEFIKNYVDLMKLRYVDEVEISLKLPGFYNDVKIPVLLFISFLENAFKYGTSYQQKSIIEAVFEIEDRFLIFSCKNNRNAFSENNSMGGIGLQNSKQRLDLLYKDKYSLTVQETEEIYFVQLKIPI
ncbi:MAG: sensor histidine kinase [Bacteroidales bacterium]|jgi:hypothetical protein